MALKRRDSATGRKPKSTRARENRTRRRAARGADTTVIDLPEIVAEVTAAFERYERALMSNDIATLDKLFHDDPRTVRYGAGESLYGYDEIKRFRAARSPVGLMRALSKTVITTYGCDFAVASTLFSRDTAPGRIGRQTQTWVRRPEGWRVVVGHVSVVDELAEVPR